MTKAANGVNKEKRGRETRGEGEEGLEKQSLPMTNPATVNKKKKKKKFHGKKKEKNDDN